MIDQTFIPGLAQVLTQRIDLPRNTCPRTGLPWKAFLFLLLAGSWAGVSPAWGGVGFGDSPVVLIDTGAPLMNVDQLPEFFLIQGGDSVTFHWTTADDNPGTGPDQFTAAVMIDGVPHNAFSYYPDIDEYSWEWTAPDVSTANVHLEVVAKDAYGNTRIGITNDFTVLSSVTDVPRPNRALTFAAPAPNPFNPATRLQFHLPEAGRVDLAVFDAAGRRIRTLVSGTRGRGEFEVVWDGRDDRGRTQSGGVYLFVLDFQDGGHSTRLTRKAVLIP